MSLKIGSLFSGYKGLDLAVESVLDAETAWFVEYDKAPSKILAHHWPDVPNYGDITTVDWSAVEPVDILTGGSPCQDLSHAGKRQGMTEGTRSNLWVAMREAIAQLRPSLVVWENVRGAYSAEASSELEHCPGCMGADRLGSGPVLRALGRVLGDLSDLGYDARWHGLRAADVGAPHGRFRVFVVAYLADADLQGLEGRRPLRERAGQRLTGAGSSPALLPTPAAYDGDRGGPQHPDKRKAGGHSVTLQDAVHGLTLMPTPRATDGTKGGPNQRGSSGDLMLPSAVTLLPTPVATDASDSARHTTTTGVAHSGTSLTDAMRLLPTPAASDGTGGKTSRSGDRIGEPLIGGIVRDDLWGQYAAAIARWESLTRPAPSPTQPSKKGTPQLSPAFSEWLMGLPAGHVTDVPGLSRNDQLKALGNGVVPQQAAAALRHLLSYQEAS